MWDELNSKVMPNTSLVDKKGKDSRIQTNLGKIEEELNKSSDCEAVSR